MYRTKVFQKTGKGDQSQSVKIYTTISYLQLYLTIMYTQVVRVIELREVQLQLAPGPPLSLKLPKVTWTSAKIKKRREGF